MSKFEEFEIPVKLTREQQTAALRAEYPLCAESADLMRELFGEVEVLAMTEGDKTTQRKSYRRDSDYLACIDGNTFLRLGRLAKQAEDFAQGNAGHAKRK